MPRAWQSAPSPTAHRCAPAEWPSRLIRVGSPPYSATCWLTHSIAASAELAIEIERGARAQLVIDDDRGDSAWRQLGRNEGEVLLVLGPPIAAVHEDMDWRGPFGRHGGEDVEAAQLVLAIG